MPSLLTESIKIGDIQAGNYAEIDQNGNVNLYNGGVNITGGDLTLTSGAISNTPVAAPGAGISGGTGTLLKSSVVKFGDIIRTSFLLDLTGLGSSTTDLDIIGTGASAAYLAQITAAINGTILSGRMTCLEVPVGGADDIDLYSAVEATGVFDGGIEALDETALVTAAAAWTLGLTKALGAVPAADEYLYLTGGEDGTAAAYTAGKFLIELDGYVA
ncbi:hypothetical protein KAR91_22175 [Candidatus Pacearchaeota archaeon]|nr:hypothetical protein [Candidatus Pacearchaeota archaeon]